MQELISNGIGPLAFNSPFDNLACLRSKFKMIDFFSHSNLQIVSYAAKWLPGVRIPVVLSMLIGGPSLFRAVI